jgi:3-methyladenine DNA glycosylase/8-oxoguanine DNA glycosylase
VNQVAPCGRTLVRPSSEDAPVTVVAEIRPRGPYSLRLTARHATDATRRLDERGIFTAVLRGDEGRGLVEAWQRPDGAVVVRAPDEAAVERARFLLALDDDHSDFLRRFASDPLLGRATKELQGLRPARLDTVAHALLRAFCGQLIDSRTARALEAKIVRGVSSQATGRLRAAPSRDELGRLSAPELRRLGLHARRSAALVRLCRSIDLERLRTVPTATVLARLGRERGVGPWSVGVVCLEGLGRMDHGLVGDLGLVKLLADLRGRRVEGWETAELLEPYGEWAGLASVYLLAAYGAGLLPRAERRRRGAPPRLRPAAA